MDNPQTDSSNAVNDALRARLAEAEAALQEQAATCKRAEDGHLAAMAKMKRAVAELEQFAYITSHDLQAPLRNITGFTQLLEKRHKASLPADAQEFLGYIISSVRHMQNLIEDILTFSRVGRTPEPQYSSAGLADTLDRALSQVSKQVLDKSASVSWAEMPTVTADHNLLVQLFLNIFDNAVKFQLPGNKPIVVVKAEAEAEHWRISISDNGIGIAAEHLEAIFAVFRRLHTQDEYPGTGIGLAICQKVAVHHGGSITAESAGLGQGACFVLRLPFHPSPAAGSA